VYPHSVQFVYNVESVMAILSEKSNAPLVGTGDQPLFHRGFGMFLNFIINPELLIQITNNVEIFV